jgi:gliding motility-associated-like protein
LKSFRVYNRWGQKVFETQQIDEGWDGVYNDHPQPVGVYVYIVEAVTRSGRYFYKQGNVTLIR